MMRKSTIAQLAVGVVMTATLCSSVLFAADPVAAPAGDALTLTWSTLDGGGVMSRSGEWDVGVTIGQPDAGTMTGGEYELNGGFWTSSGGVSAERARYASASPAPGSSLWQTAGQVVRFRFDAPLPAVPVPGELLVRPLGDGGGFGADISGLLEFALEDGGAVLRIADPFSALENETWYGFTNDGGMTGVEPFDLDYVVVYGDANGDMSTNFNDLSFINAAIGVATPDPRAEINGDGTVNFNDLSTANSYLDSSAPPKPPAG